MSLYSHSPVISGEASTSICMASSRASKFKGLAGRGKILALPDHIFFLDQLFDDGGPGGRGAEAAFLHGVGEFLVLNQFVGIFHGREQGGLIDIAAAVWFHGRRC